MKTYLNIFLALAVTMFTVPAVGDAVIFSGANVKALKPNLDLNGGAMMMSGTTTPSGSAVSANRGSIYMNTNTGFTFQKTDNGSSTNWVQISTSANGLLKSDFTAKGDTLVGLGSTSFAAVAVGSTSGYVYTANPAASAGIDWQRSVPAGSVIMFGGSSCPTGWQAMDGSAISRTTYADLFAVMSTTYGVGDGSTTFNVPNAQGVFIRGSGSQTISAISYTGTRGTTQGDQFQGHFHDFTNSIQYNAGGFNAGGGAAANTLSQATGNAITNGSNGTPRTGSETRPANITLLYCIRL